MEKGILACLKEDISNVAKQDIIILGLQYKFAKSKPVYSRNFSPPHLKLTLSEPQKVAGGHVEVQMLGIKN